jgi:uncharacterized coiled-coil protein SlyX
MENYKTIKADLLKQKEEATKENKAIESIQYNKKPNGEDFALISKAVKNYEVINNKYCSHPYIKIDNYILSLNSSKTSEVKADFEKRFAHNQKLINDVNIKINELKNTYDIINKSIKELYAKIEEIAPNTKYYYDIHNLNRYDDRTVNQYEQDERNEKQYNFMWDNLSEEIYKIDKFAFRGCTHKIEAMTFDRWAVTMNQFDEVIAMIITKDKIIASKKITDEEAHQITMNLIKQKNYSFVNKVKSILNM